MVNPRKIALLSLLYFVQGMPFGFQAKALPIFLRTQGVSTREIGWLGVLALPWLLKPLWAPLVDRYGTRRQWIIPLQLGLASTCVVASFLNPVTHLAWLLGLVLLMNVFAATQDIAVDGLAIELLAEDELGPGNSAQVVGYKLGMLLSGGLLLTLVDEAGWSLLFLAMASVAVITLLAIVWIPSESRTAQTETISIREIVSVLVTSVRGRAGFWLLILTVTYKSGEAMNDAMFKPFLVDIGLSVGQIGLWLGTWGMAFSIAGSVLGGVAVIRYGVMHTLLYASIFRLIPLCAQVVLAVHGAPGDVEVIAVTCAEHFFGGALTTVMFAFMMKHVDRSIGATHFTALAALEVVGKMWGPPVAGTMVANMGFSGYSIVFVVGSALSAMFVVLVWCSFDRLRGQSAVG
ncbi:MAG: MFS transporter [Myxococcota bacterium]|nr:MFS transporter [Myxococcota bacterium]